MTRRLSQRSTPCSRWQSHDEKRRGCTGVEHTDLKLRGSQQDDGDYRKTPDDPVRAELADLPRPKRKLPSRSSEGVRVSQGGGKVTITFSITD